MSRRRVKWGKARSYFRRHGYEIRSSGGEKVIVAPPPKGSRPTDKTRHVVTIGHKYCSSYGDELLPDHLRAFKRAFGVTVEDILE